MSAKAQYQPAASGDHDIETGQTPLAGQAYVSHEQPAQQPEAQQDMYKHSGDPVYVQQPSVVYVDDHHHGHNRDPNEFMLVCAVIGCLLSWIPIIGCCTFIINCDAPPGTPRKMFATTALIIAIFVVFFNVIFWPVRG
jgi:hypothetical protein